MRNGYSFRHYIFDLLDYLAIGLKRVSVIVPNYNYERYQPERLQTIRDQTYPAYEIVYLDDCSSDNSVAVAEAILKNQPVDWRLVRNVQNSGSVFLQWQKGVELAKGDYVWLAEADDSSEPEFLEELLKPFDDPEVVLSYCESKQLDEQGNVLAKNYLDYVFDISAVRWTRPYVVDGIEEIRSALSIKNTIPNVSGVLLKRSCLKEVLVGHINDICSFRIAGDWFVYVLLLRHGKLAFTNRPLNGHRRHSQGVTIGAAAKGHLNEIVRMQEIVAREFSIAPTEQKLATEYTKKLKIQFKLA
ncbi:MAG: glycosyltransferase family 2 protein [Sulfuritalea sp.]|nr:glycosyltransferase family 2 protein [Sulfuritalea sp.]